MLCMSAIASISTRLVRSFPHTEAVLQSLEDLVRVSDRSGSLGGYICQQEVLFPLQLALRVGGLNEDNHYSMDYELWGKFFLAGAPSTVYRHTFRFLPAARGTEDPEAIRAQTESTLDVADSADCTGRVCSRQKNQEDILADLQAYREAYPDIVWKHTGRLARLGLPPSIVAPIRTLERYREEVISSLDEVVQMNRSERREPIKPR